MNKLWRMYQGNVIYFLNDKFGCAAKVQGDRKALVALRKGRNLLKGVSKRGISPLRGRPKGFPIALGEPSVAHSMQKNSK